MHEDETASDKLSDLDLISPIGGNFDFDGNIEGLQFFIDFEGEEEIDGNQCFNINLCYLFFYYDCTQI